MLLPPKEKPSKRALLAFVSWWVHATLYRVSDENYCTNKTQISIHESTFVDNVSSGRRKEGGALDFGCPSS